MSRIIFPRLCLKQPDATKIARNVCDTLAGARQRCQGIPALFFEGIDLFCWVFYLMDVKWGGDLLGGN